MKFYRHKTDPSILSNYLEGTVTLEKVEWIMDQLRKEFAKGGSFTTVNIIEEGVVFNNTDVISSLSEFVFENKTSYRESIYVGLADFHKVLLKMHISLMRTDMDRMTLKDTIELREKRGISFPEDFKLVAEYSHLS